MEEIRRGTGVPWEVLERDYVLSWILAALSQVPELGETLAFKGGTALKKCYFGDYRFSEDLDFTALDTAPRDTGLQEALVRVGEATVRLARAYAPLEFELKRYRERDPHPAGQEAFTLHVRLPWHREGGIRTRVLIEITRDEELLWPAVRRRILHGYGEELDFEVQTYAVEEIVAEKLRALLQQAARMRARGWSRSRARDIYDLWRLLTRPEGVDRQAFTPRLLAKCSRKGVGFQGVEDFLAPDLLAEVRRTWKDWLGHLVTDLPDLEQVLAELKPRVEELLLEPPSEPPPPSPTAPGRDRAGPRPHHAEM